MTDQGRKALIRREGSRNYAYPDPASQLAKAYPKVRWGFAPASTLVSADALATLSGKPWTCGVGQTGADVTSETYWTNAEVEARFTQSVATYEAAVTAGVGGADTADHEFDAMVSFAFNVGIAGFNRSTVLRAHKAGDKEAAARAFRLWNKPAIIIGRRREEELQYATPYESTPQGLLMPVTPERERSPARSEINIAATAGAVSTIVAAVSQSLDLVRGQEVYFISVITVGIFGYIIYQRLRQRRLGWA